MQMVIPESDLSTLDKVDASSFNVTTYKAAFTKQVRRHCTGVISSPCVSRGRHPAHPGLILSCCLAIGLFKYSNPTAY